MAFTINQMRSECAILQAGLDILCEHLRQEDEVTAMHKVDHARDLVLEAYNSLGGNQPGVGEKTNAVYVESREALP